MTPTEEADWLAWRDSGVGATDVAKAHTGKYGGSYDVVAGKLGRTIRRESPAMDRGKRWEDVVTRVTALAANRHIAGAQTMCNHPTQPRHLATVDGFVLPNEQSGVDEILGCAEIKTCSHRLDAPPYDYYRAQTNWQMYVTGLPQVWVGLAIINDDTDEVVRFEFWVELRDEALIAMLVERADWLLELIDSECLPDVVSGDDLDAVKDVWRTISLSAPNELDLTQHRDLIVAFERAKASEKRAEEKRKKLEAELRDWIADSPLGTTDDGYRVSVGQPANTFDKAAAAAYVAANPQYGMTVLDKDRLKRENPTAFASLSSRTGGRTLRVTKPTKTKPKRASK